MEEYKIFLCDKKVDKWFLFPGSKVSEIEVELFYYRARE